MSKNTLAVSSMLNFSNKLQAAGWKTLIKPGFNFLFAYFLFFIFAKYKFSVLIYTLYDIHMWFTRKKLPKAQQKLFHFRFKEVLLSSEPCCRVFLLLPCLQLELFHGLFRAPSCGFDCRGSAHLFHQYFFSSVLTNSTCKLLPIRKLFLAKT